MSIAPHPSDYVNPVRYTQFDPRTTRGADAPSGGDKGKVDVEGHDTVVNYDTRDKDVVLFETGYGEDSPVHYDDVDQGQLADCYAMAAIGAVAANDPGLIEDAIEDNGDGTYTVTFKEKQDSFLFWGGGYEDVEITVNGDFPEAKGATASADGGKKEIWPLILEKAYAQYKGGYDQIGNGGTTNELMGLLTGREAETIDDLPDGDYSFDEMKSDFDADRPITLNVPDNYDGVDRQMAEDTYGLVDWHYYVVTDVGTDPQTGEQYVEVYNPQGVGPAQRIPYDDAMQIFDNATKA